MKQFRWPNGFAADVREQADADRDGRPLEWWEIGLHAQSETIHELIARLNNAPSVSMPPMTLRDWFAGQALASPYYSVTVYPDGPSYTDLVATAKQCYAVADAMLAARQATEGGR